MKRILILILIHVRVIICQLIVHSLSLYRLKKKTLQIHSVFLSFGMYTTCIPKDQSDRIHAASSVFISNCCTD